MSHIQLITLETPDPAAAEAFYRSAFAGAVDIDVRASIAPTGGFRGFTLSLVVAQPSAVDALVEAAVAAGASIRKPVASSFWGYGGVVQAPDGAIWKIATSAKKDTGPASTTVDDVVLLLGVADVKASKRFYVERGFTVKRSFGGKYAEFEAAAGQTKLALYNRRALAKDAGVPADGDGSHRVAISTDSGAFTDPDGFTWETAVRRTTAGPTAATAA